jgi:hypothetical protein
MLLAQRRRMDAPKSVRKMGPDRQTQAYCFHFRRPNESEVGQAIVAAPA